MKGAKSTQEAKDCRGDWTAPPKEMWTPAGQGSWHTKQLFYIVIVTAFLNSKQMLSAYTNTLLYLTELNVVERIFFYIQIKRFIWSKITSFDKLH